MWDIKSHHFLKRISWATKNFHDPAQWALPAIGRLWPIGINDGYVDDDGYDNNDYDNDDDDGDVDKDADERRSDYDLEYLWMA